MSMSHWRTPLDSLEPRLDQRPIEVDVARLLLIVDRFAVPPDASIESLRCRPERPFVRYLTPEYYLQKLDFLVRYPAYLAYELIELHDRGIAAATDANEVKGLVRQLIEDQEPELRTTPFRRFWRGAYESIDRVEAWWHAHGLAYTGTEPRREGITAARPQKYFFLTAQGEQTAANLIAQVPDALWYYDRISLIHRFFGALTAAELKAMQYSHPSYKEAQLNEYIPDLSASDIRENFRRVFGEELDGVNV